MANLQRLNAEIEQLQLRRDWRLQTEWDQITSQIEELELEAAAIIEARGKARLDALRADYQRAVRAAKALLGEQTDDGPE